jgi:hypothetical protein
MIEPHIYGQWRSSNASPGARLIYMAFVIQQFVPIDLIWGRAYGNVSRRGGDRERCFFQSKFRREDCVIEKRGGIIPVYVRMFIATRRHLFQKNPFDMMAVSNTKSVLSIRPFAITLWEHLRGPVPSDYANSDAFCLLHMPFRIVCSLLVQTSSRTSYNL